MLEVLDRVNDVSQQYPPETGHESRFGNPAFRKFYDQVSIVSIEDFRECFYEVVSHSNR